MHYQVEMLVDLIDRVANHNHQLDKAQRAVVPKPVHTYNSDAYAKSNSVLRPGDAAVRRFTHQQPRFAWRNRGLWGSLIFIYPLPTMNFRREEPDDVSLQVVSWFVYCP